MSTAFELARILVAIDESPAAASALDFAIALGVRYGSELLVCTAVDHAAVIAAIASPAGAYPDVTDLLDEYDRAGNTLLQKALERATAAGVRASTELLDGAPVRAIAEFARERPVNAIVMGTHGREGLERMFLGSTAQGVLRVSNVPTFVIRERAADTDTSWTQFERILIGIDDSDPSDTAAEVAIGLATKGNAELLYCTVMDTDVLMRRAMDYGFDPTPMLDELQGVAQKLVESKVAVATERGAKADGIVVEGGPADALLETATERRCGLIAIGTHGRGGLRRLFLGSVAESVVRRSPVPVVVVRSAH